MTLEQKIQAIREKCIAANPEIGQADRISPSIVPSPRLKDKARRPIRLADVLLAIDKAGKTIAISAQSVFLSFEEMEWRECDVYWNLRADDLNSQIPETINFLYELLK